MGNTKPHIYEVQTTDGFSQLNKHIFGLTCITFTTFSDYYPYFQKYFKLRFRKMQLMNSSHLNVIPLDSNDQTFNLIMQMQSPAI